MWIVLPLWIAFFVGDLAGTLWIAFENAALNAVLAAEGGDDVTWHETVDVPPT